MSYHSYSQKNEIFQFFIYLFIFFCRKLEATLFA